MSKNEWKSLNKKMKKIQKQGVKREKITKEGRHLDVFPNFWCDEVSGANKNLKNKLVLKSSRSAWHKF